MKLSKLQLRRIVHETVKAKLESDASREDKMRITKQGLQQLIDEEYSRAISRRDKRLKEGRFHGAGGLYELDSYELIEFAQSFADLGNAVQDQLREILDQAENDNVNPNAIAMIKDQLGGANEEIDTAISVYEEWLAGTPAGTDDDVDESYQMEEQDDTSDEGDTGMTIHGPSGR